MTSQSIQAEAKNTPPAASSRQRREHAFLRHPTGTAALLYLVLLVLTGAMAPVLTTAAPDAQDLTNVMAGPGAEHLLGTDTLGRDVLTRLLYGIVPSLQNSAIAIAVFLVIGVPVGILAGFLGGRVDQTVSRIIELMLAVPPIIFILVVLGVFSASPTAAMVALGVLAAPGLARVVRGAALLVREELYVTAAKVAGVRPLRIMATHILRPVLGPVLAQATIFAGISLSFQAALSFLGLLGSGTHPTWGGMIGEASQVIAQNAWLLFPPGLLLALTVLAFGLLGDAIRDISSGESPSATRPRKRLRRKSQPSHNTEVGKGLLKVSGLEVSAVGRAGDVVLVDDATFTVMPGETVAIVGESGCGKSMTALALLGLLPEGTAATGGSVLFDGVELLSATPTLYRTIRGSGIAYIAQDALGSLDPTHTVGSHLEEVIRLHEKSSRDSRRQRSAELLRQVEIRDVERVLRSYPHEISGGMAQRINIAIALAGRPRLIIADEPTTALDVTVQAEILRLLRELQKTTGMAVLLITHDWGVVADLADRAVVMYAGEVVEQGPVDRIFQSPTFPYTTALLSAEPSRAPEGSRLPTLSGRVPPPGTWPTGCRFAGRCAFAQEKCLAGPISISWDVTGETATRCVRADELVPEGALVP